MMDGKARRELAQVAERLNLLAMALEAEELCP